MAGIVSKDIARVVKMTTTEIDILDRIYYGDVDAYNIDIDFYGVSSITGSCNLHFVLPDGTTLDRDESDGVVIDGNNVKYTLDTYLYQQSGNLVMYVQFMNSNIYTPLKVNFKNIVSIPDGGEEVVETTTYPVWYDDAKTDETAREAAEVIRESNEDARIAAETLRVTAENTRATWEEFNALTVYAVGEKVYYPTTGSSYILHTASGVANTLPTDTDHWQIIAEKGASGTIDALSATDITGVIAGDGSKIIVASASNLPYVNTTSGLDATNVQDAIDEINEDFNTAFSEIDSVLSTAVAVHAYKTSAQSIPSSNPSQIVQFETELYDTHGMFDSIANNTRLTCKVDGYYLVVSRISFSAHTNGYRAVYIMKNGSLSFTGGTFGTKFMAPDIGSALLTVSGLFYLEVDDYLEMWAEQQSLANLTIPEGNFCMMKLA